MPLGNFINKLLCEKHEYGSWRRYDGSFVLYGVFLDHKTSPQAEHCLWFRQCPNCTGRETELEHTWGPLENIVETSGDYDYFAFEGRRCRYCSATTSVE